MFVRPAVYVIALLALTVFAQAQMAHMQLNMPCWPHADIIRALGGAKYQEGLHSFGISQKNLVELYVSKQGSWTLLTTAPLGLTCVLASGDGWEPLPQPKYGKPT